MATLKKTILGRLSGTVGDLVFRNKKGRNFVSSKPASFNAPSDEASLERRARFGLTIKFATSVGSIPELKEIWRTYKPSRYTTHNFIIKENYPLITHEGISNAAMIVPPNGFLNDFDSINVSQSNLTVEYTAIGNELGIDPLVETNFRLAGIIFLSSPVDSSFQPYSFISVISGPVPVDLNEPLVFTAPFSAQQSELVSKYQTRKAFCTVISFTAENKIVNFARTFTG